MRPQTPVARRPFGWLPNADDAEPLGTKEKHMTETLEGAPVTDAQEAAQSDWSKQHSFSDRQLPWLKIAHTITEESVGAERAAELGGLGFDVELVDAGHGPLKSSDAPSGSGYTADDVKLLLTGLKQVKSGRKSPESRAEVEALMARIEGLPKQSMDNGWRNVRSRRAAVRADNEKWFGYVSSTYKPVQYREAFTFMDGISPRYLAAGTLGEGRQGFMVAQLPGLETLNIDLNGVEDKHDLYIILRTSHDLSKAIEVAVMSLRGRCMNQVTLPSFTKHAAQRWSIRHVGDPAAKLAEAKSTLVNVESYRDVLTQNVRRLHEIDVELDEVDDLLKSILPDRPKRSEQIDAIRTAWHTDPTVGSDELGMNGWTLTNAVNSYFEWGRESGVRTDASRFTSGLNGSTHKYTSRIAQVLLRRSR